LLHKVRNKTDLKIENKFFSFSDTAAGFSQNKTTAGKMAIENLFIVSKTQRKVFVSDITVFSKLKLLTFRLWLTFAA
jgi:hypothetical protein